MKKNLLIALLIVQSIVLSIFVFKNYSDNQKLQTNIRNGGFIQQREAEKKEEYKSSGDRIKAELKAKHITAVDSLDRIMANAKMRNKIK